jgi:hypothetical protein
MNNGDSRVKLENNITRLKSLLLEIKERPEKPQDLEERIIRLQEVVVKLTMVQKSTFTKISAIQNQIDKLFIPKEEDKR